MSKKREYTIEELNAREAIKAKKAERKGKEAVIGYMLVALCSLYMLVLICLVIIFCQYKMFKDYSLTVYPDINISYTEGY